MPTLRHHVVPTQDCHLSGLFVRIPENFAKKASVVEIDPEKR